MKKALHIVFIVALATNCASEYNPLFDPNVPLDTVINSEPPMDTLLPEGNDILGPHFSLYDVQFRRIYICRTGYNENPTNYAAILEYNIGADTWKTVQTINHLPEGFNTESNPVVDAIFWEKNRSLVFLSANYHLWFFDLNSRSWHTQETIPPTPFREDFGMIPYTNGWVIFGGSDIDCDAEAYRFYNDLWILDLNAMVWQPLTLESPMEPRSFATGIFLEEQNTVFIYGGRSFGLYDFRDIWSFDLSSGCWTIHDLDLFRWGGHFQGKGRNTRDSFGSTLLLYGAGSAQDVGDVCYSEGAYLTGGAFVSVDFQAMKVTQTPIYPPWSAVPIPGTIASDSKGKQAFIFPARSYSNTVNFPPFYRFSENDSLYYSMGTVPMKGN